MNYYFANQYLNAFFIVALFFLASYIATFSIGFLERASAKSKSGLNSKVLQAGRLPIRYFFIILGLFFAGRDFSWTWNFQGRQISWDDLFFVFFVLLAGFTASRILKAVLLWYKQAETGGKSGQTMLVFLRKIISAVIYIIALMIILGQFEVQIAPLLAGLGVAGLAIAFGLQETMANLFAALFIVLDKSINVGDWIQLEDGTKAYIEDISWRSVRIRTISGNTVIVPNSKFVGQNISSYDYPVRSFYTSIAVGVAYGTDLEKAEYVARQSAEKVIKDEGVKEAENNPIIRYKGFGDSAIDMIVIVKVDKVQDEGRIQHALVKQIHQDFKAAGVEIPFPQRVIHKAL